MHDRHAGDFGNIVANQNRVSTFSFTDPVVRLRGPTSILGRGLIVCVLVALFSFGDVLEESKSMVSIRKHMHWERMGI